MIMNELHLFSYTSSFNQNGTVTPVVKQKYE